MVESQENVSLFASRTMDGNVISSNLQKLMNRVNTLKCKGDDD